MTWSFHFFHFMTHVSGGVLWFHVVHPSVCCTSVRLYFRFRTITWVNVTGFSRHLVCALILWRFGFGMLMGTLYQFLTVICPPHTRIFVGVVGCGEGIVYLTSPRGIQLILAYSWAKHTILVAGKGWGECFYFFCFFTFIPVPLPSLSVSFYYLFSPFLWETTQNDPQGLTCC